MGFFRVKSKTKLHDKNVGERIEESDFAVVSGDEFVQLEYVEEQVVIEPYDVKPGIWSVAKNGGRLVMLPSEFTNDGILDTFTKTQLLSELVDKFFSRLDKYAKRKIEVPKRAFLLYGPAGTGKTEALKKVSLKYVQDGKTSVIFWKTDVIDPYDMKEFVKTFNYVGVERIIVIAEDIGGVEVDQVKIKSESSLLSLLDNQEKAFKIPVLIIATTNYPANLMANLTNRPKRIDRKIEFGYPSAEERRELLKFFDTDKVATPDDLNYLSQKKFNTFTPAHVNEIFIRSDIEDMTLTESIDSIQTEIEHFNNMFEQKMKMGIAVKKDEYEYGE